MQLRQPFRRRRASEKGKFEQIIRTSAYWQMRMLNLESCLSKTHLNKPGIRFNLQLSDPVEDNLEDSESWRGLTGEPALLESLDEVLCLPKPHFGWDF